MKSIAPARKLFGSLAAAVAVCLIASCGGGGGGSVTTGADDQGPVVTLPPPEAFDTIGAARRLAHDGEPASRVAEYLGVHASGGPWDGAEGAYSHPPGLVRFASPPTVRIVEGASDWERAITAYAVALINRALPYELHLTIGDDFEDVPVGVASQWQEGLPGVPDGELFVDWVPELRNTPNNPAAGHQAVETSYDEHQERWEKKRLRASSAEMNREDFRDRPDHQAVSVLVHEILHSLGLQGHVDAPDFEDSSLYTGWFRLDGSLSGIDAAGLQALYTRLGEETEPEDLSAASLGAWSRETVHLSGELDGVAFGVRHNNGVSMPWTSGAEPSTALEDNDSLSGTATWNGGLVGFTPDLEAVGGNAELSIDLGTMDGSAEFTELQSWAAGAAPGALGTGSQWNTGSLGYTIAVAGNYLRSTGGDDGTVNGQFYGAGHEGVAGSVERDDLTAAFGAERH